MNFSEWIDTFLEEKGIDTDMILEVEGDSGANFIPVAILVDVMKQTTTGEQRMIKNTIVNIDFLNGDVLHYFRHVAQAIAI